jgi:hypothetical protein
VAVAAAAANVPKNLKHYSTNFFIFLNWRFVSVAEEPPLRIEKHDTVQS